MGEQEAVKDFALSNCHVVHVSAEASSAAAQGAQWQLLKSRSGQEAANHPVQPELQGLVRWYQYNCLCWNQASKQGQHSCPLKKYSGTARMQQQLLELQQKLFAARFKATPNPGVNPVVRTHPVTPFAKGLLRRCQRQPQPSAESGFSGGCWPSLGSEEQGDAASPPPPPGPLLLSPCVAFFVWPCSLIASFGKVGGLFSELPSIC